MTTENPKQTAPKHRKQDIDNYLTQVFSKLFADRPDAANFITHYREYIHMIDDLIDSVDRPSAEEVLKVHAKASLLFSLPYWRAHASVLCIVEQLSNNTYADSVKWEKTDDPLLIRDAACLRHTGVDMFFSVILLEFGRDTLREYSSAFREYCHRIHMNDGGSFV